MCAARLISRHAKAQKPSQNSRRFLDHRGIMISDPIGALAHLRMGRAYAVAGDKAKAKSAYQNLLSLWKDADPSIPILSRLMLTSTPSGSAATSGV
jgi:hypothetical protein